MKKTIYLFSVLLSLPFLIRAQTIDTSGFPMLSQNPKWTLAVNSFFDPGSISTEDIGYQKDTSFCNKTYSIYKGRHLDEGKIYIRSEGRMTYYLNSPADCDDETLLYDFNLDKGDVFFNMDLDIFIKINSIEKIELFGKTRKAQNVTFYRTNDKKLFDTKFIEGIGCLIHPFFPLTKRQWGQDIWHTLYCARLNQIQVFGPLNCAFKTSNKEQNADSQLFVYPNPTEDEIFVKGNFEFPLQCNLYDALGKKIKQTTLNAENEPISLLDLPKGIYLLNCLDKAGNTSIQKIIKE
jgi:hypothetical protein